MRSPIILLFFALLALLNVCLVFWNSTPILSALLRGNETTEREHTYIGDDYPLTFPIEEVDTVAMTLQETVRLQLNATDPVADAEWLHLSSIPNGVGRLRLGPEYRIFVVTVYHQMHCIRKIEVGLMNRSDPVSTYHHVRHCLNYLRQTFLCDAADMLEAGDFMKRNYEVDRVGDTLVCQDWNQVYEEFDRNYQRWAEWRELWN